MTETVESMPHMFVEQNMSSTELEFEFESGERQTLRFPMPLFEQFMGRAAELVMSARSHASATTGHVVVRGVTAVEITAQAPHGGGKVLLQIVGDNGVPINFFLSAEQAQRLRPELSRAAKSANKQASEPRH